jgi:hypothetical protein
MRSARTCPAGGGRTITATVNMRSGPGTARHNAVITQLTAGTRITVEGAARQNWLLLRCRRDRARVGLGAVCGVGSGTDIAGLPVTEGGFSRRRRAGHHGAGARGPGRSRGDRPGWDLPARLARGNRLTVSPKWATARASRSSSWAPLTGAGSALWCLQTAIDHFAGLRARQCGRLVRLPPSPPCSIHLGDPAQCAAGETPLACERVWQPSFVIISMEVWYGTPQTYEENLRAVLDFWIGHDVVPILATKADNREGDWSLNAILAKVAWEYDVPLWNFLMAAQPLPGFGLTDGFHLSWAQNHFGSPAAMQNGWPWRNLTALQSLDSVWRGVGGG